MRLIDADEIKIPYKRDDIYYRNTYSSGVTAMVHAIGKRQPSKQSLWCMGSGCHIIE